MDYRYFVEDYDKCAVCGRNVHFTKQFCSTDCSCDHIAFYLLSRAHDIKEGWLLVRRIEIV